MKNSYENLNKFSLLGLNFCSSLLLEKNCDKVLNKNQGGESEKGVKSNRIYGILKLSGKTAAADHFDQDKENSATIKGGDRKKIHNSEVDADHSYEVEEI